jgi:hypothetical protein
VPNLAALQDPALVEGLPTAVVEYLLQREPKGSFAYLIAYQQVIETVALPLETALADPTTGEEFDRALAEEESGR